MHMLYVYYFHFYPKYVTGLKIDQQKAVYLV